MPPIPLSALACDALHALLAVWLFAVGGTVGSFLNVVVYRLPRRMSLVRPGSHCPACRRPIRWHDNVPVLAWLWLRGRCRDCHAPISARYPVVEAITAVLFAVLFLVECATGGSNLPATATGFPWADDQLWGIYAYHLMLLCTLLAAALIDYDGRPAPWRLGCWALAVGLVAPAVWPHLRPVHTFGALVGRTTGATIDGLLGLAAGVLLGLLAARLCRLERMSGLVICSAGAGLFLGWPSAGALTVATVSIDRALAVLRGRLPDTRQIPPTVWLALGTLIWIFAWSLLARVVQFG